MIDWKKPMRQTFEFRKVTPYNWEDGELLTKIENCTITHDDSTETKYSANFVSGEPLGEMYVRVYLSCTQNGQNEKYPLGTFLTQTGRDSTDGKSYKYEITAYSPLLELADEYPEIGYAVLKKTNAKISDTVFNLYQSKTPRLRIVPSHSDKLLDKDFITGYEENILSVGNGLLAMDDKVSDVDEMGKILFKKIIPFDSMVPVWDFTDDNSSILYPDVSREYDFYGIPNVIEVVYTGVHGTQTYVAVNNDPQHPLSIVNRGRTVKQRIINPEFIGVPTEAMVKQYADQMIEDTKSVVRTITIKHGFCNVRAGECVWINYRRKGLVGIKARIIRQTISCTPGTPVESTCEYVERIV